MKKFGYLLSAMLICGACLFGCGTTDDVEKVEEPQQVQEEKQATNEETEPQQEAPVKQEEQRFGLGDTLSITTSRGDYEITFIDAYFSDERNQYSDEQVDKVLVIVYEYKNVSYNNGYDDDGLWICEGVHYQVFGEDGFSLGTYPNSLPYYQDYAPVGRSSRGSEVFGVYGDQHHFEIEIAGGIVEFDLE